jgi:hypothetical protein
MAGANPALIVRVAANLEDLKKGLVESKQHIEQTTGAMSTFATKTGAVPEQMRRFTAATTDAGTAADRLQNSLRSFDGVLASMGVNVGPGIRGLTELGEASGKTVTQLGLIATAGLVVGAGMAGWKIGRAVADFFDLDKKIGDATAKLLGFGDVGAAAAGAKADVLAKASKAAGIEIKDMALAMAINEEVAKTSAAALAARTVVTRTAAEVEKAAADAIHASNARLVNDLQAQVDAAKPFRDAMGELNSVGAGWKGTLDTIDGTVVEGIKFYLQAGVSQKALAEAYGLTDAQVKAVASALRDEADATRQATADTAQLTKAQSDFNDELERQAALKAAEKKEKDAVAAAAAKEAKARHDMGGATQYDLSTEAGRSKVPEDVRGWLHSGWSFEQANLLAYSIRMGFDATRDPLLAHKGPAVPGFKEGGVGDFGRGTLAMLHGREAIVPLDRAGGNGLGNTTIQIYITQPLGTPSAIAAAVDAALMKRLRDTGVRF